GFNDFIAKPVDIKRLDVVLNRWVRDTQNAETLQEAETQAQQREESPGPGGKDGPEGAENRWLLEHPLEGVDFAAALTLYGNSGAALMPILKSFVAHTPPLLERMDAHLETSLSDYAVEVHGLKGTCSAICAAEAAALAKELEFAAKDGQEALVRSRHGELKRQAQAVTERLQAMLEEWDASLPVVEKELRSEPDRELLARLSGATGEFNSSITEEVLGELEQYRYAQDGDFIFWLREQAENFDYEIMHDRLEEILGAGR
ncbi:MAG: Hpt domain-containing protein, partial [Treponema sp.]|nr:Hpt domain-containing protein [Treponema sp.]